MAWQVVVFLRRTPRLTLRPDGLVLGDGRVIPWSEVTSVEVATVRRRNRTSKQLRVHVRDREKYVEGWQLLTGADYVPIEVSGLSRDPEEILRTADAYRQGQTL
jgi:hypothetical protein